MSDRILVTGGAGFVGSSLVRRLLEDGCEVSVVDNHLSGPPENLASVRDSIRFVSFDESDRISPRFAIRSDSSKET